MVLPEGSEGLAGEEDCSGVRWGGPCSFWFTYLAFHYPAEAPLDRGSVMISPLGPAHVNL